MRCKCGSYEFHETGRTESTLMSIHVFVDAQGRQHIHDPNRVRKVYRCAQCDNLNFHPMEYTKICPVEDCGWQRKI